MVSFIKGIFSSLRLWCFKRAKLLTEELRSSFWSPSMRNSFLDCELASPSAVAWNCVSMISIKESTFSFCHVRKYLNKGDKRGWFTVSVIRPVHILGDTFHNFLLHCVVEIVEEWAGHSMFLSSALHWRIVIWTNMKSVLGYAGLICSCKTFKASCL